MPRTRAAEHPASPRPPESPLTEDEPPSSSNPAPSGSKSKKGGGGKKAETAEAGKRKRASSSTSSTPATGGRPAQSGSQAALARVGLQASRDLCDVCKDVLVGSHVIIPCRHLLCNDCVWDLLLHLLSTVPTFNGVVHCPECAAKTTGFGGWPTRDEEVKERIMALSTSTYAYRSRDIRQGMFERKPSVQTFIRATPLLSHLSYGIIDSSGRPMESIGHPRSSSGPEPPQLAPSSTPQRPVAVPSHQQRTPASQQQQQIPSAYPTPQTEVRGGGYPAPPPPPRRTTSGGGHQSRSAGGSEKLWMGDLIIPAHGGGEVHVPVEGWTLGLQPHIPSGLLPHPISLRNFVFTPRTGGLRPTSQVLHFRPVTEDSTTVRIVSEPQLEQIRRAEGLVRQLCETIQGKGALGVSIPGVPGARGEPHLIFDAFSVGRYPDGTSKFGLIGMVNPSASEIVARMTGTVPVPLHAQTPAHSSPPPRPLPPASSAHQIQDFARQQQEQQMRQQYHPQLSHQQHPQDPNAYRPPPIPRVEESKPSFADPPLSMPPFRPVPNIALPPVPSVIPPHLQAEQPSSLSRGGSQEFLSFGESASPEPSRFMESSTNFDPGEQYYEAPESAVEEHLQIGREEHVQEEEMEEQSDPDATRLEEQGEADAPRSLAPGEIGQTPSWMGALEIALSGDPGRGTTRVEETQGQVEIRSDLLARFDPFLFPPTLSFFASPNFDDQQLELFGRLSISIDPQQDEVVRLVEQAAEYKHALLFQMTATDHQESHASMSSTMSEQKVLLRLRTERREAEDGRVTSLVADLHLVP